MKETTIALENVSPGLAEWVARARREHTTFVVLDAAVPVARLVPTAGPRLHRQGSFPRAGRHGYVYGRSPGVGGRSPAIPRGPGRA